MVVYGGDGVALGRNSEGRQLRGDFCFFFNVWLDGWLSV